MGTAKAALVAAALLVAADAHADTCTGTTASGGRFAKCFDLGNRLSVTAGSDGFGASVKLRHLIRFDDEPDLVWKLEHTMAETTYGTWRDQLDASLYRGRFLRHARDGHIVLPLGIPKKVFLPFDIGAEVQVGSLRYRPLEMRDDKLQVGVVKIAALVDFARTRGQKRRFAIGPVVRWDIDVDRSMGRIGRVSEHAVSPFSVGMMNLKAETQDGIWVGELRAEAGTVWHTQGGWKAQAEAEATLERIMIAINDRPIALTAGVSYATANDEAIARVGARVVLMHRNDKRVNLKPLKEKTKPVAPPPAPKPVVAPPPPPDPPPPAEPVVEEPPAVPSGGGGALDDPYGEVPKIWEL
ncbi:MAG: hypothetical protein M4D80_03120 [Myxococcota bacterium]|nr:hypothetical protein [Myxococcota bacterium]